MRIVSVRYPTNGILFYRVDLIHPGKEKMGGEGDQILETLTGADDERNRDISSIVTDVTDLARFFRRQYFQHSSLASSKSFPRVETHTPRGDQ